MEIKGRPIPQEHSNVTHLKQGDPQAFNAIFSQYSHKLYCFAYGYLKSREDAEEVVQDTFVRLWKKRETLDESLALDGLLFTIVYRLVLNKIRDNKKNNYCQASTIPLEVGANSTEQAVFKDELEALVEVAVAAMPPKRKAIFQMSRYQELCHQEIAEQLKISKKTVEAQITEALKALRRVLHPAVGA